MQIFVAAGWRDEMKNSGEVRDLKCQNLDPLEIYEGMTFNPLESSKVLDSVGQKFEEYCILGLHVTSSFSKIQEPPKLLSSSGMRGNK